MASVRTVLNTALSLIPISGYYDRVYKMNPPPPSSNPATDGDSAKSVDTDDIPSTDDGLPSDDGNGPRDEDSDTHMGEASAAPAPLREDSPVNEGSPLLRRRDASI